MRLILEFLKTQKIDFSHDESNEKSDIPVLELLEASSMYQFESIQEECISYIINHWLSDENVLQVMFTADKLSLTNLYKKTKIMSYWNFSQIRSTDSFLDMNLECLLKYLDSDYLRSVSEFEVFEAVCTWLNHAFEERVFNTYELLSVVRFGLCSEFDLNSMKYYSLISETPQAVLIVDYLIKLKQDRAGDCEACVLNKQCSSAAGEDEALSPGSRLKRKRAVSLRCTCTDATTVETANKLLVKGPRTLPLAPCVVANLRLESQECASESSSSMSTSKFMKQKLVSPFLFYWDGTALKPEILLTKIDEGPCEAIGYRTVCKDLKLYVVGGEYLMGYGAHNTSVWVYDIWRETWTFETSVPKAVRNHALCFEGDCLYVIGGVGKHRVVEDTLHIYNLVTKAWRLGPPLPLAMYSAACCVYKEQIFVFGSIIVTFRPKENTWIAMNNIIIPNNLSVAAAMTDNEWMYVIANTQPDLYRFKPYSERVELEHLGRFQIEGKNACLVNNVIYKFGYDITDYKYNLEMYSIETKTFKVLWECTDTVIGLDTANEGCFPLPINI
ncbi:kelch-like protein 6 [Nilaparvata lugens]|uniref:kelch-like protein 6 n=1 Tax=Nilaparvata lugens TaxID=108931 RepID=UPI00193E877F|nr:kelch-like protein 6 [Nilaparvata lugens]